MRNAMRAVLMLCVLSGPTGCQLIKRLTNRGQDSGTTAAPVTPTPVPTAEVDAGDIAVPNPTVAPMPEAPEAAVDSDAAAPGTEPAPPVSDDTGAPAAPEADAGAAPEAPAVVPTVAEPVPSDEPRRRRGPRNYCKDHPGRVNPYTGAVCPMTGG